MVIEVVNPPVSGPGQIKNGLLAQRSSQVNNHPQSGWPEFSSCGTRRRQEKTKARFCFDVELAVAPGLGKNQPRILKTPMGPGDGRPPHPGITVKPPAHEIGSNPGPVWTVSPLSIRRFTCRKP
jgi:hypothetical protein